MKRSPAFMVGLVLAVSAVAAVSEETHEDAVKADKRFEKPPHHWPNNLDVRNGYPGCWKPPGDRFSRSKARRAVVAPFAANLDPADLKFGDSAADVYVDGFVKARLRLPRDDGRSVAEAPCEISLVQIGPRKVEDEMPAVKTFLVLTSHGKMLWKKEVGESPEGTPMEHYKLSRVITQFEKAPFVLLFCDSGGSTRNFYYELFRVTPPGPQQVWISDWWDGHSGSTQQGYSQSNFDFSTLRSCRAHKFIAYTTSGNRRWMKPGDDKDLKPTYTKRVYQWEPISKRFVKVAERSFSKARNVKMRRVKRGSITPNSR